MPAIPEKEFSVLYSANQASRPNTPVNMVVGSLIIKELFDLTDDELLESILCDVRFQYALGTTSYPEQPFSDRTFSRLREKVYDYEQKTGIDLIKVVNDHLVKEMTEFFKLNASMKRMDSLMIASNCKKMSRLELIYTTVANMIKKMNAENDSIPEGMEHYLKSDDRNRVIYHEKNSGLDHRMKEIAEDALELERIVDEKYDQTSEYELLKRVILEQMKCADKKMELKDNDEIKPDSIQTPYDPEATFRSKAGKNHVGYVGNVIESFDDGKKMKVIESYDMQANNYSDICFCKDELKRLGKQEERVICITDGAYGSEETRSLAEVNNIELVCTTMTGKETNPIAADFEIKKEEIICPMGKKSIKMTLGQRGNIRALFEKRDCENCPLKDQCLSKEQKKTYVVMINHKQIERAKYVKKMGSEQYQKLFKKRNGVEAIPSLLRRKYKVDKIPVMGRVRKKLWFGLKIIAINAKRAISYSQREQMAAA